MFLANRPVLLAASALFACLAVGARAQQGGSALALTYDSQTRGPVPIPPSERGLQTVVAEPWFKVSEDPMVLEGPCFDRNGNLIFSDVSGGRVLRLTPDKQLSTVLSLNDLGPGGLAIHKDGRIFITGMNMVRGTGSIVAVEPDGTRLQTIAGRFLFHGFPRHLH
jgi:lactonase